MDGASRTQVMLEYDTTIAFQKVSALIGGFTSDEVEKAIESLDFEGVTGRIKFTAGSSNPGPKPFYILCAQGGYTHSIIRYMPDGTDVIGEPVSVCHGG